MSHSMVRVNLVPRDFVVDALAHLSGAPEAAGKVYQLASGRPITWDTVVPYLAERLGAPCSTFDLPVTPTHYEHDLSAARRDFGYDPPFSYRQMVDDAVRFARGGASDIIATKL